MVNIFLGTIMLMLSEFLVAATDNSQSIEKIPELERVDAIRIFVPRKNEMTFRGSQEQRIHALVSNPPVLVVVRDFQRVSDFLFSVSKSRPKKCVFSDEKFADSVVHVVYKEGKIAQYFVYGKEMKSSDSGLCYSVPSVVAGAEGV